MSRQSIAGKFSFTKSIEHRGLQRDRKGCLPFKKIIPEISVGNFRSEKNGTFRSDHLAKISVLSRHVR